MNMITLREWLQENNDPDSISRIHYFLDRALKHVHLEGYYIYDFNLNEIFTNGVSVNYRKVYLNYGKNSSENIHNNILSLTALIIRLYNKFPLNTPIDFLKDNFKEYKYIFPFNKEEYYFSILGDFQLMYYSDYCDFQQTGKFQQSAQRNLNKSTMVGRMMSSDESGYANFLILPAIAIIIFIVSVIIYFIFIH